MGASFRTAADWVEADYRKVIASTLDRVGKAFENIDPDLAECELRFGILTINFPNRTKIILSAQPAVRQLWLALAAKGTAYHFGWDEQLSQWRDDKGRDIEVLSMLRSVLAESGVQVQI